MTARISLSLSSRSGPAAKRPAGSAASCSSLPAQPFSDLRLGELAAFKPQLTALPERHVQQGAAAKLLQIGHLRPGIDSLSPRGRTPAGEKELRLGHDREQERQPDRDPAADRIRKLEVDDHDRDDDGTHPPDGPDSTHLDTNVTATHRVAVRVQAGVMSFGCASVREYTLKNGVASLRRCESRSPGLAGFRSSLQPRSSVPFNRSPGPITGPLPRPGRASSWRPGVERRRFAPGLQPSFDSNRSARRVSN